MTPDDAEADSWHWDGEEPEESLGTKPSDVELYERRCNYYFAPDTPTVPYLPPQKTPEEQVAAANLWEFFRFVRFRNGHNALLQWYDPQEWPIVVMSPSVKLTEGANFAFGARWAGVWNRPVITLPITLAGGVAAGSLGHARWPGDGGWFCIVCVIVVVRANGAR